MTKMMNDENAIVLEGLSAEEIWSQLYGQELNTKNTVLTYIDLLKVLKNGNATEEQIQECYTFVYQKIDEMSRNIKPNTIMFLKNALKQQLGKLVKDKDPRPVNHFIEFFKEAYPPNERRKDFTWVLMDLHRITEEQIWHTLRFINKWAIIEENGLESEQMKDIIAVIEILVRRGKIKYINQVKSFDKLNELLGIKIVNEKNRFVVVARKMHN